jgi:Mn2+/Fe2+ NRAMP family transporter
LEEVDVVVVEAVEVVEAIVVVMTVVVVEAVEVVVADAHKERKRVVNGSPSPSSEDWSRTS